MKKRHNKDNIGLSKGVIDLRQGPITFNLLRFSLPLMIGNVMQQMYNIADTYVVGKFIGAEALAAVGSAYTLMTFLTSIILGLSMGAGASISMEYGAGRYDRLKRGVFMSFTSITMLTFIINVIVYVLLDFIISALQIPNEIVPLMKSYLTVIFAGIFATFLYNYVSNIMRAVGNSLIPLIFLAAASLLNVALDLFFVIVLKRGVAGAAEATIISQYSSGIGISIYCFIKCKELIPSKENMGFDKAQFKGILNLSLLTSLQQSIMNFGILMIQGLVNSFGTVIMAAFAAAVKIDTIAYMPVQDFGNAFSTFIAQNFGAGSKERIRKGFKSAFICSLIFCLIISLLVFLLAESLMKIFIDGSEVEIISEGVKYLRIEGACYVGIGFLFLFYGYYRAINRPAMSVILTIASLGTRVALAYILAPIREIGVIGIWAAIPIGWAFADLIGYIGYMRYKKRCLTD